MKTPKCLLRPSIRGLLMSACAIMPFALPAQTPKPSTLPGQSPPILPGTPQPTLPAAPPVIEKPDLTPQPPVLRPPPVLMAPIKPTISSVAVVGRVSGPHFIGAEGGPPAPRQDANVRMELQGLRDAESFKISSVRSDCQWKEPPRLLHQSNLAPGQHVSRSGVFMTGGQCRMFVELSVKRPGLPPEPVLTIESPTFALTPTRVVRIDATSSFAQRLGLHYMPGSIGVCGGESRGTLPPFSVHPVGLLSTSAGDISIVARSGPAGTLCRWRTEMHELPPGVHLTRFRARATASSAVEAPLPFDQYATCGVGNSIMSNQPGPPSGYDFDRGLAPLPTRDASGTSLERVQVGGFPPIVTEDGVVLLDEYANATRYRSLIAPMHLRLRCGITATNDHYGQLVVDALEFTVPDNIRFP